MQCNRTRTTNYKSTRTACGTKIIMEQLQEAHLKIKRSSQGILKCNSNSKWSQTNKIYSPRNRLKVSRKLKTNKIHDNSSNSREDAALTSSVFSPNNKLHRKTTWESIVISGSAIWEREAVSNLDRSDTMSYLSLIWPELLARSL